MKISQILMMLSGFAIILANLKSSQMKYDYLLKQTLNSENGVIYLEEKELSKYLNEFPRDYDLFVFITTSNCYYCKTIEEPFLIVAQTYKNRQTYYPLRKSNGDIKRPIFFIHSQVGYNSQIFTGSFKLKSYPNIYFSQADEIFITEEFEKQNYMDINFWRITMTDVVIDEAKIIEWCNKHSQYDVQLERSVFGFFKLVAFIFWILFVLFGLFYYAEAIVLNEKLWLLGALAVYVVSAGGLYSFFHSGSPFIGQKKGQVELFMSGTRNQYGIEGLLVIASLFVVGFSLILFTKLIKRDFDSNIVKFIILFLLMQTAITVLTWLEQIFKSKNFYSPNFMPPDYYIRGDFFTKDQGNIQ